MKEVVTKANVIRYIMLGFAAWTILTCFSRLGDAPVYIDNEAREGIFVRAMLEPGGPIFTEVPNHVGEGEIIPDKPPLFHWLATVTTVVRSILTTGRLHSRGTLTKVRRMAPTLSVSNMWRHHGIQHHRLRATTHWQTSGFPRGGLSPHKLAVYLSVKVWPCRHDAGLFCNIGHAVRVACDDGSGKMVSEGCSSDVGTGPVLGSRDP